MEQLLMMSAAIFAAGFLRGISGFGFALAAVPILSMVVEPLFAVIVVQILQISVAPYDFWRNRKSVDLRALGQLFTGALIGAPIGALFAKQLDPDVMRILVACFVLLGLVAIIAKLSIREGKGPAILSGALSGLLAGLAAMPGPPAVAYFLGREVDKEVSRASLLIFFAGTAFFVLTTLALTSDVIKLEMFKTAFWGVPALIIGSTLGATVFKRLGGGSYRSLALVILFTSAVMTGWKGLSGLI